MRFSIIILCRRMIGVLCVAIALLPVSKAHVLAQTAQMPFDTSTLDALMQAARTPVEPHKPAFQPVPPVVNPTVDSPPVDPGGENENCKLRLIELEDSVTALTAELIEFKTKLGQLRPEVSRIQEMLRRPGAEDYCGPQWNRKITALSGDLKSLAVADFRDRARALMFCAIAKNPELQQLKRKADAQDNQNELQKLALVERRLVDVDIRAGTLTTEAEALFREVGRYRQGVKNADNLCSPIVDF